jgi:MFS family permease
MSSLTFPPALRHRQFVLFWIGLVFVTTGTTIQSWTALWAIRELTPDPIALATAGLIRFAPLLVFSLVAGIAADMFSRRAIMIVTQLVMGLVSVGMAWGLIDGWLTLNWLYILICIQATAAAFTLPAHQSFVPNLVPNAELRNAMSLQILAFEIGGLMAPVLSGYAIDNLGSEAAFGLSAVLILLFPAVLLLLGQVPQELTRPENLARVVRDIGEGLTYVFKKPLLASTMILDFLATFMTRADVLMPYFARDLLGLDAVGFGWLSAAQAIGAFAAGATVSLVKSMRKQGRVLLVSVAMIGVGTLVFGLSRSFWLSMAALIVVGASDTVSAVIRNTIRQLETPDRMRGRVVGVNQIFFIGGPHLGDWKTGVLGGFIGVPLAVVLGGIGCLLSTGAVARMWPQIRDYEGDLS